MTNNLETSQNQAKTLLHFNTVLESLTKRIIQRDSIGMQKLNENA